MSNIADQRVENYPRTARQGRRTDSQVSRTVSTGVKLGGAFYLGLVLVAEYITMRVGVLPGAIIYSIMLVLLTNLSYFSRTSLGRRVSMVFIMIPLLRILSLVMPVQQVAPILRYMLVGIPLLISTILIVRVTRMQIFRLNLTWLEWTYQIVIGMSGIPLGVIAGLILTPPPDLVNIPNLFWVFVHWIVLTLFSAVTEEIIFRGLLQKAFNYSFGVFGIFVVSLLYAAMFMGTLSPGYIIFFGLSGLLFSIWVRISDSLLGVIMAHSLLNIVFLLIVHLVKG